MEDDNMANCYDSTFTTSDGVVNFEVRRELECDETDYAGGSYVVALDAELSLIASWNPKNSQLSYHGKNKMEFKQTLGSDGKCAGVATEEPAEEGIFSSEVFQWVQNQFGDLLQ